MNRLAEISFATTLCVMLGGCGGEPKYGTTSRLNAEEVLEAESENECHVPFDSSTEIYQSAKEKLSLDQQALLGEWNLALAGGNDGYFNIPSCVHLLPFKLERFWAKNECLIEPVLIDKEGVGPTAYWHLDEQGELVLRWQLMSGMKFNLREVNPERWEGSAFITWDFQYPGMDEPIRYNAILERK